jgi:hypothetical protein
METIDSQSTCSLGLLSFFEFLISKQITNSQDEAIAVFKPMLDCPKQRTVDQRRFFEYFEELSEHHYTLLDHKDNELELEKQKIDRKLISFAENQSSDDDYSIFKTSPLGKDYSESILQDSTRKIKDEEERKDSKNLNIWLQFCNSPSSPPGQSEKENTPPLKPALRLVDLTSKNLLGFSANRSRASKPHSPSTSASGPNGRRSQLRPPGSPVPAGRSGLQRPASRAVASFSSQRTAEAGRARIPGLPANAKSGRLAANGRGETGTPRSGNKRASESAGDRLRSASTVETAGKVSTGASKSPRPDVRSFSNKISSFHKSESASHVDGLYRNGVFWLLYDLLMRESKLEALKGQLASCEDLNLERLFNSIDKLSKGYLTKSQIIDYLFEQFLDKSILDVPGSIDILTGGRQSINFFRFCEWFFPLSNHLFIKMKKKVQTLAPQFIGSLSNQSQSLVNQLLSTMISLKTIKIKYEATIDCKQIDNFNSFGNVQTNQSLLECIEAIEPLALHSNEIKERVADLLADPNSKRLTLSSLNLFWSDN